MPAAAIDLCTLSNVQAYLDPDGQTTWVASQVSEQQALITEASQDWLEWTGRRTLNRAVPFNDAYDGSGGYRQFVADYPILKVFSVFVDGLQIPAGSLGPTGQVNPGYIIDRNRESISLVGVQGMRDVAGYGAFNVSGTTARRAGGWRFGRQDNSNYQNVQINMLAGPSIAEAEFATVPAMAAFTFTVANSATFSNDLGVINRATGVPLTLVASGPAQGQYSVAAGIYTFNALDAGAKVSISYGYDAAPFDIVMATAEMVATVWKRQRTLDQKSVAIPNAGSNTMRDWMVSPKVQSIIDRHTRRAQVGV